MKISFLIFLLLSNFTTASNWSGWKENSTFTVENTVETNEFSDLAVCPALKLVAARLDRPSIAENKVHHEWRIIEWPLSSVRTAAIAGDSLNVRGYQESSYPQWSSDCQWLYFRALNDGEVHVWRLDSTSGVQEKVTSDEADILNFELSENGQTLTYETSATREAILAAEAHEYQNGVIIGESLWPGAPLTETFPVFGRWVSDRRWDLNRAGHLLSKQPKNYKTINIQTGKSATATMAEITSLKSTNPEWVLQPNAGFILSSAKSRAAVVLTTKETVFDTIRGRHLEGVLAIVERKSPSQFLNCDDRRCASETLVPFEWYNDESSVFFIAEQKRGAAGIYQWSPSNGEVRTILETEGLLGSLSSGGRRYRSGPCPTIGDIAFCTIAEPETPPRLIAISLSSGDVKILLNPNEHIVKRFSLKAERLSWKDSLGRDAIGVLVYPRNYVSQNRYPLVITTYRCPGFLSGGVADGGPEYVLAEKGFVVLCIDKNNNIPGRLSEKYSPTKAEHIASLAEYESAITMLADMGIADNGRVGITGLSYSARAISYAITRSKSLNVISLRSLGDLEPENEKFYYSNKAIVDAMNDYYGVDASEENRRLVYDDLSLTLRAHRVATPIMLQASDTEYLQKLSAFSALKKLDKPIEMIVFPEETHQLHQPVHRYVNFTRNLDWFRFWLQGYEDPDPEKADQYVRWRKMRDERCAWDEPEDERPVYCEFATAN